MVNDGFFLAHAAVSFAVVALVVAGLLIYQKTQTLKGVSRYFSKC